MTTLVSNPTGDDLADILGRGNDVDFSNGAAQTAVSMAREMAVAYTRGRGFEDEAKVPRVLFHVILQRAVRLLGNPQQLVSESRDGVSMSYGLQAGQGFTWAETLLLNDFRKTAGTVT